MKKIILALFFVSIFSQLQGCAGGISDERTISQKFSDNALSLAALKKINKLHISNEDMRINFFSNSGYLLVIGQVSNQQTKDLIDNQLNTLKDVKGIYNAMRVTKPIGFAQQSEDSWITTKIKGQFTSSDLIDPFKIKVITENAEVFLIGKIDKTMANTATDIARDVEGVKLVNRAFQLVEN